MTENPLKAAAGKPAFVSKFTAMEWARMARDKGLLKQESAWLAEAKLRGEIPSFDS
jgi:hypothetical protein